MVTEKKAPIKSKTYNVAAMPLPSSKLVPGERERDLERDFFY